MGCYRYVKLRCNHLEILEMIRTIVEHRTHRLNVYLLYTRIKIKVYILVDYVLTLWSKMVEWYVVRMTKDKRVLYTLGRI